MISNSFLSRMPMLLLAALLTLAGWLLSLAGFDSMQSLRQIERLAESTIASALPGEVKLNARVVNQDNLLSSEYFNVPSVYYVYRFEIEKTDSDGDKYWSTQYTGSDRVNFLISDITGQLLVNIKQGANDDLNISLPQSAQVIRGAERHTEWRIEANDDLFVVGKLTHFENSAEIGFIGDGQYTPIISKYGEQEEKSDIGLSVVLMVAGGISLIALAAFALAYGLQIHRIIGFLFILSFSVIVPLVHLGTSMLYQDIVNGEKRMSQRALLAMDVINHSLTEVDINQSSWPQLNQSIDQNAAKLNPPTLDKIRNIQLETAYSQHQFIQQIKAFPNNLIAWLYTIELVPISESFNPSLNRKLALKLAEFKQAETLGITPVILSLVGLLFCVGLSWMGFSLIRLKRHIENVPTSKSTGLVFGLAEIKGRIARCNDIEPLQSPLAARSCYWFHYIVKQKQTSGDKTKWVTIEDRQCRQPFLCKDVYGDVKVNPDKAEIVSYHVEKRRVGDLKYYEKTLRLNDPVYILGHAKIDRETGDSLEIRANKKDKPYLITNLTEHQIMMRKARWGMLSLTGAFSTLMFACLFYLGIQGSFSPADYLLVALIAPIYMSFVILVLHYNDLIFLKQRAARNKSNIEVSMQKRFDLIANLEKVVKKYLVHESQLQQKIAQLRTQTPTKSKSLSEIDRRIEAQQQIITQVIARSEAYPELKASKINVKLMNKLIDLENEVALMREGYNDAATGYNTRIATVPDVFFARAFGFNSMALLTFNAQKLAKIAVEL